MIRLAWRNVSRDWTRSFLAIGGMAAAAIILASALTLANTHQSGAYAQYRYALGGDIIALPGHFLVDRSLYAGEPTAKWSWHSWDATWQGNLSQFIPGIGDKGYLAPAESTEVFNLDALNAVRPTLESSGVQKVYPYLELPAFTLAGEAGEGGRGAQDGYGGKDGNPIQGGDAGQRAFVTPLRARDPAVDGAWLKEIPAPTSRFPVGVSLAGGRWLNASDDGKMVAVVSAYRPAEAGPAPSPGQSITVSVPEVSYDSQGRPSFDFGHRHQFELQVAGVFNMVLDVRGELRSLVALPWETGEIMIPSATFAAIHQQVSGGRPPVSAGQLGLVVDDMTQMGTTLDALTKAFPDWTVLSAPHLASMANRGAGGAIPADLTGAFVVVAFLLAGALAAGNMYVVVHQRSKQIGILKSVGASAGQVFVLVLAEVAGYALVGGTAGLLFVEAFYALTVLSSGVTPAVAFSRIGSTSLLVLGTVTLAALVFGLAPAWFAATRPTAQVLRND